MNSIEQISDDEKQRRESLLAFLAREEPVWRDEDHPDLAAVGTYAWVRALRDQSKPVSE